MLNNVIIFDFGFQEGYGKLQFRFYKNGVFKTFVFEISHTIKFEAALIAPSFCQDASSYPTAFFMPVGDTFPAGAG